MRLGQRGREKPAVWAAEGEAFDVSSLVDDYDARFFAEGGIERVRHAVRQGGLDRIRLSTVRVGPPVARPSKLMAVGLNYADHAQETGKSLPEMPLFFDKAPSSINGPYDDVVLPSNYATVDYEVELALVIGQTTKRVTKSDAYARVAGYLICNDVSERTAQSKEGGQFYRGKSFDTFAPIGPYLVTPDEVGDPNKLSLVCKVDGEIRQNGHTSNLIFDIPTLIEFISRNITLEPGDIITTGTPAGVANGMRPPRFLRAGQVMDLEISGLGQQRSHLVAETDGQLFR